MAKNSNPRTRIVKCICAHESQDLMHGAGNRVCNLTKGKGQTSVTYRCTVCAKLHEFEVAAPKTEAK